MSESFLNGRITLHCGDCLDVLATLSENSIDSCVTDPPYHLVSIQKRFASAKAESEDYAINKSKSAYMSRGFMGKQWDGGDIAQSVDLWVQVYRVLKPGAHLLAFGGTRTYHRMACAIEDAGFEIRDCIQWLYGSGFPKSHDVSKGIDRTRAEVGRDLEFCAFMRSTNLNAGDAGRILRDAGVISPNGTMAAHFFARTLAGQPAIATRRIFEAMRPHLGVDVPMRIEEIIDRAEAEREKIGEGFSGIGTAIKNGEWSGLPGEQYDITVPATDAARQWQGWGTALKPACEPIVLARKPLSEKTVAANVLRWGTGALNIDGCRIEHSEECKPMAAQVTVNSIIQQSGRYEATTELKANGRWPANVIHDGSEEVVGAFPETQTNSTGSHHTGEYGSDGITGWKQGAQYEGDKGSAARFFYTSKADSDDRLGSRHPTVKPLGLMQYLVRLVTPKGGAVLDPFAGTGTTGEAAWREGMKAVLIEREAEYQADIRRRMELCLSGPDERQRESIKAKLKDKPLDHGPLFGAIA